jgi:hypothetical protein
VASSATKVSHSATITSAAWSATISGIRPAATISAAFARSTPAIASTGIRASASGRSTASCSISIPPSAEHIAKKVRLLRSSRNEK